MRNPYWLLLVAILILTGHAVAVSIGVNLLEPLAHLFTISLTEGTKQ